MKIHKLQNRKIIDSFFFFFLINGSFNFDLLYIVILSEYNSDYGILLVIMEFYWYGILLKHAFT